MSRQPQQYENPLCRELFGDPDIFVEETKENIPLAKACCKLCPHRNECAEYGLQHEVIGIWGGLDTKQRSTLANQRGITRIPIQVPVVYNRKTQGDNNE